MDLLVKVDKLLNNTEINLNLNNFMYQCRNETFLVENIAEKENDAQLIRNDKISDSVNSVAKFIRGNCLEDEIESTDEFEECIIYNNDDSSVTSEDNTVIDEMTSCEKIENFIKECESVSDEQSSDDKEKDEPKTTVTAFMYNENNDNLTTSTNNNALVVLNQTEVVRNNNDSVKISEINDEIDESNQLMRTESEFLLRPEPDFKVLESRINLLWKEIDDVQKQIKEEKEFNKTIRLEITDCVNSFKNINKNYEITMIESNVNSNDTIKIDTSIIDINENDISKINDGIHKSLTEIITITDNDNNTIITNTEIIENNNENIEIKEIININNKEIENEIGDSYKDERKLEVIGNECKDVDKINIVEDIFLDERTISKTDYKNIVNLDVNIKDIEEQDKDIYNYTNKDVRELNPNPHLRLSNRTEAKIKAKKEILKRFKQNEKNSDSFIFKQKLQEIDDLCKTEMNKINTIISQLDLLQYDGEYKNDKASYTSLTNYDTSNINVNTYQINQKQSNISLPDQSKLKYESSTIDLQTFYKH